MKKELIDIVNYEIRRYTELAERMDELLNEYIIEGNYSAARKTETQRNCYNQFIKDLKNIIN